ncbi:polyphenol oxidase family protein [Limnobacter humi]|uniref:Polyphenol oxidase family protein n=1 Tax=Limnobacter humi TaxID=1778671 RepID=A0ABT1WFD3_9BURK|nr:polyphenol oxidase family protein [Limnobacter humi]MCQ8896232.1 polyphenol oxidase family protein [Limnobacter humi]
MLLPDTLVLTPDLPRAWAGVQVWLTASGFGTPLEQQPPNLQAWVDPVFGFNVGDHVGDDPHAVTRRRAALSRCVGAPIQWLKQVHGCEVLRACSDIGADAGADIPQADAAMTDQTDVALAIMTADCLPAVFVAVDDQGQIRAVGAAHAGWRGLHAGVLTACATSLARLANVSMAQVQCMLGPAIGPNSFEVGQEVRQAFVGLSPALADCFKPARESGKWLGNLYALATQLLADQGVSVVACVGGDTFTDLNWFSHRRGQQQGVPAGRQAMVVRRLPSPFA